MEGTNFYRHCISCGKMIFTVQERLIGKCKVCQNLEDDKKGKK